MDQMVYSLPLRLTRRRRLHFGRKGASRPQYVPDGRRMDGIGARYVRLCLAFREALERVLALWAKGGRQKRTPRAFARLLPPPVRARISSRSNSANPPSTVSINRPCEAWPRVQYIEQVSRGSRQPIQLRDDQHVTGLQRSQQLGEFGPVVFAPLTFSRY